MAVRTCSKCGEDNREGARTCMSCSSPLGDAELKGVPDDEKGYESLKASPENPYCSHCKERLEPEAVKCRYCGTMTSRAIRIPRGSNYYDHTSADGSSEILLYVATLVWPIVGLIVGGIYALHDQPEKQEIGRGLLKFGLIMTGVWIIILLWFAL